MKKDVCKKCQFENSEGSIYCQGCGEKLKQIESLKQFIKTTDLGGIVGTSMKGISIAPLFCETVSVRKQDVNKNFVPIEIIKRKDGTFYCPYCGTYNKQHSLSCSGCGKNVG